MDGLPLLFVVLLDFRTLETGVLVLGDSRKSKQDVQFDELIRVMSESNDRVVVI